MMVLFSGLTMIVIDKTFDFEEYFENDSPDIFGYIIP